MKALLFSFVSLTLCLHAEELLAPPQTLKDADGRTETGLVDPFAAPEDRAVDTAGKADDGGFTRTSLGEISTDFKILGIVVPTETNLVPTAVLQLNGKSEPVVVRPGETVRIEKAEKGRDGRRNGKSSPMEDKLKDYTFYLYVKTITATHLEVYHNKKRPDETIILNW